MQIERNGYTIFQKYDAGAVTNAYHWTKLNNYVYEKAIFGKMVCKNYELSTVSVLSLTTDNNI